MGAKSANENSSKIRLHAENANEIHKKFVWISMKWNVAELCFSCPCKYILVQICAAEFKVCFKYI